MSAESKGQESDTSINEATKSESTADANIGTDGTSEILEFVYGQAATAASALEIRVEPSADGKSQILTKPSQTAAEPACSSATQSSTPKATT